MSELSRSSKIRHCLYGLSEESDNDDASNSDVGTDLEDFPDGNSSVSLQDYSSGSGEEYDPNLDQDHYSDSDDNAPVSNQPSTSGAGIGRPRPQSNSPHTLQHNVSDPSDVESDEDNQPTQQTPQPTTNWVRVYPPEPAVDLGTKFRVRMTGVKNLPDKNSKPLNYFYLFFSEFIWSLMIKETNLYAQQKIGDKRNSGELSKFSRLSKWVNVTKKEMKRYIAIIINMGLSYKNNYKHYWSTRKSQKNPFYSETMGINRFEAIRSNFHLSSLKKIPKDQPGHDPWYKIRAFYEHINASFKMYFVPGQNIAIDESMVGMKNRCSFIQYMPNKRHARFGIKKFELCDSESSYVLHSEMYSGKGFLEDNQVQAPFTQKVVMHLLSVCNLLNKGYHLYTDNFYTKVPLAEKLIQKQTYMTGTINKNSKDISKNLVTHRLEALESVYYRRNQILLVGYKQKKTRKPVYLLSTALPANDKIVKSKKSGIEALKPELINEYNLSMGGVDVKDKSIYHTTSTRPTKKYWKKLFDNFLDMALLNAYILYKNNTDVPQNRHDFMADIVESLVDEDEQNEAEPRPHPAGTQHTLARRPGTSLRLCVVCVGKGKHSKSRFWCSGCNAGIHPDCYKDLNHFWRPKGTKMKRKAPAAAESDSE